ncbi:MAG: CoA-transferase, partial [Terriglobales bacterium]
RAFRPDSRSDRAESARSRDGASAPGEKIVRLPGSGGACDIASLAQRFVVLLEHDKRRLPECVSYVTSPGYGDGKGWRERVGLPRGGPSAAITTQAVLRFGDVARPPSAAHEGEAYLASAHPGVSVEDVVANTGWKLRVAERVEVTPEPTTAELTAIREYDKKGFWTK